jgi:hypothetical protein
MNNFDWQFYLELYPDLIKNNVNNENKALKHYNKYGKNEGRICNKNEFNNFDWKFYLKLYPDLIENNIDNKIKAYRHYNTHGKDEGRIPNKKYLINNYYKNLKLVFDQFNTYNINLNNNQKLINILIRTTKNRKQYLEFCLNSIFNQKYKNYLIYIHYDDDSCLEYLKNLNNKKVTFFNSNIINENENKYKYNLYCNYLLDKVQDGFVFFLDDDDCLSHNKVLNIINDNLNENKIIKWKFLRPDKIIYSENKDIKIGDIVSCGFIFHSKFKNKSNWIDKRGSDFYFFDNLVTNTKLDVINLPYILTKTIYNNKIQNFGNILDINEENKFINLNFFNLKNIYNIKVSESLLHFKKRFKYLYNLSDDYNTNKPTLFFGCYNMKDLSFIKNHKSQKYIIFGGSDIDIDQGKEQVNLVIKSLKKLNNIYYFSISSNIYKRLNNFDLKSDLINFSLIDKNIFKKIKSYGNKIFIYNGLSNNSINFEKYGGKIYSKIQSKLKNFQFILSSNLNLNYEDMPKIYSECFIGLRLTNKDGNANTVQEFQQMNIPIVHNLSEYGLKWKNLEDIIFYIQYFYLKKNNIMF